MEKDVDDSTVIKTKWEEECVMPNYREYYEKECAKNIALEAENKRLLQALVNMALKI